MADATSPMRSVTRDDRWLDIALEAQRGALTLNVTCRFQAGWTVLFGPSGSGKSSLLRLVAGLDLPRVGSVVLGSATGTRTLTDMEAGVRVRPEHRRVALATQRPTLFPHRTVRGNVLYGARNCSPSRLRQITAICRIEALLDRAPTTLSGGERQRVALARSLMPENSDALLLDEPFTGTGEALRDIILHDLRAWLQPQRTPVLLVTHDLGEVFASGAAVLRMEHGTITGSGPAAVVLAAERAATLARLGAHTPA